MIEKITKPIVLKYENRMMNLPEELKEKIEVFWGKAEQENPSLYNGEDFAVENIEELEEKIVMHVVKTNYAHYLYNERIGIENKSLKCVSPWGGILLLTNDNYWVIGEMSKNTSFPRCLQISGGSIDQKDIKDGWIDIDTNIKRELKEEMNLDLDKISYEFQYLELPDEKRNTYGFLAVGKLDMSKQEMEKHFEEYTNYLIENHLEVEFDRLIFMNRANAIQELDGLDNPKRPYLRDLIKACSEGE